MTLQSDQPFSDVPLLPTPPDGEAHLRDLLANWQQFVHKEGDDPLAKLPL